VVNTTISSDEKRNLPRSLSTQRSSARERFIAAGSRILATKLPSVANAIEQRYGNAEQNIKTFNRSKVSDKATKFAYDNITGIDKINSYVTEQNKLLEEINKNLKNISQDSDDDPSVNIERGRKKERARTQARATKREQLRNRLERREQFRKIGARAGSAVRDITRTGREAATRLSSVVSRGRQAVTSLSERFVAPQQRQATRIEPRISAPTPQARPTVSQPSTGGEARGSARAGGAFGALGAAASGEGGAGIASAAAQGAVASAGTTVLAQGSERVIREVAARSLARQISSKIPIAGLIAGLFFSGQRAIAGDWVGAGLEIASAGTGTLGAVTFGLGTAASVSLDMISLTRDVYVALYGIEPEKETDTELRNQRLQAIGANLTTALQELITNAPRPSRPEINNETRSKILEILKLVEQDESLYNALGPDVVAGVSRLLAQTTNLSGNSPLQRRAREGLENILNRLETVITTRRQTSENTRPVEQEGASDLATPASFATPGSESDAAPDDAVPDDSAPSGNVLPYPENIIDLLSKTEFNELKLEAEKIKFDGTLNVSDQVDDAAVSVTPVSSSQAMYSEGSETSYGSQAQQQSDATAVSAPAASPVSSETAAGPAASGDQQTAPASGPSPDATPQATEPATPNAAAEAPAQQNAATDTGGESESENQAAQNLSFGPGVDKRINNDVAQKVGSLQSAFGKSFTISSGYRDPERNARVGGARNSAHTRKNAVDIKFNGNEQDTLRLVGLASQAGFGGIGVYAPGFIHIDTESKRVWGPDYTSASIPQWAKAALQAHVSGQRVNPEPGAGAGQSLLAEGTNMAVGDQALARSAGQQIVMMQPGAQAPGNQQNIVPSRTHVGEVPLIKRFENQVAA
jgi:hypothetical protein